MIKTQHKRTAVASMFQNGISQNTKCAKRDSFRRAGHKYSIPTCIKSKANDKKTNSYEMLFETNCLPYLYRVDNKR